MSKLLKLAIPMSFAYIQAVIGFLCEHIHGHFTPN